MAGFSVYSRRQRAHAFASVVGLGILPACTLWHRAPDAPPPPVVAVSAPPDTSAALASVEDGATMTTPVPVPVPSATAKPASSKSVLTPSTPGNPATASHTSPSRTVRGITAAAAPATAAPGRAPAGAAAKPPQPALDLAALEHRLKDTKAIGVFTKLSLKNQVDDLLDEFKKYHQTAGAASPPPALRSQYDLLMIKVLSLLQNGDPQLAASISSSREALWDILKDPNKFAKI